MYKNIYPITNEVAFEVTSQLSDDDKRECIEGHGIDPFTLAFEILSGHENYVVKSPNGMSVALGGVEPGGRIWLLCTDKIQHYPVTFTRNIKDFVDSRPEKLLWNVVDKRNTTHIKLLRFLGFKFLREVLHGPNLLTFIEFCKINARNSDRYGSTDCPQLLW